MGDAPAHAAPCALNLLPAGLVWLSYDKTNERSEYGSIFRLRKPRRGRYRFVSVAVGRAPHGGSVSHWTISARTGTCPRALDPRHCHDTDPFLSTDGGDFPARGNAGQLYRRCHHGIRRPKERLSITHGTLAGAQEMRPGPDCEYFDVGISSILGTRWRVSSASRNTAVTGGTENTWTAPRCATPVFHCTGLSTTPP